MSDNPNPYKVVKEPKGQAGIVGGYERGVIIQRATVI